jgi:uncharacterized metal-binding protein YceD (DUF177 family)
MKINIANIPEGESFFDFTEKGKEFEIDFLEIDSDVNIHVDLFKTNNQFDLNVSINGIFSFQCDRCLDPYEERFEKNFKVIYKVDFTGTKIDDDTDDVLKYISPKTKFFDLKEDIRDYILLSVPLRKVPLEVDDTCTFCNRKISDILEIKRSETSNPVWEKLLKIKTK